MDGSAVGVYRVVGVTLRFLAAFVAGHVGVQVGDALELRRGIIRSGVGLLAA